MEATRTTRARRPVAFVDSSAIVALVDAGDASHLPAVDGYRSLIAAGYRLFTTDHVLAETFELLSMGTGAEVARQWLRDSRLAVYDVSADDIEEAKQILIGNDARSLSFTDALSLAVMERLGVTDAFAVDPAFLAAMG